LILVDSNIPMYLVGADHPHKIDAQRLLERCAVERERLVTDVEVLQEILHRYSAINRREAIAPATEALLSIVDDVLPVELSVALRARDIVLARSRTSARDALHIAVMEHHDIETILTFDRGFDEQPGIRRLS
jgi:predicted nucleic acid-binding protein